MNHPARGDAAWRFRFWTAAAGLALLASPAQADDASVNAIYDRMSAAYQAADAAALAQVYTADALVFPSRANTPWVQGRENIAKGPGSFLTATKSEGGTLRIQFRVTERRMRPGSAVDAGLYRLTTRAADGKETVQIGKFMITAVPQAEGGWAFVSDTDTPMPADAWDRARKTGAAKFDQ